MNDTVKTSRKDLKEMLLAPEMAQVFSALAPRHVTPERLLRLSVACITRTPKLLEVPQVQVLGALVQCAGIGLEPNSPLQHVHLIPFYNSTTERYELQTIIGYRGFVDLGRRTGKQRWVHGDVVRPGDEFEYAYGNDAHLRHKPGRGAQERQAPTDAYCFVQLDDGFAFVVLPEWEILRHRQHSFAWRSKGEKSPWGEHPDRMWRKTAIRVLYSGGEVPLDTELAMAVATDDQRMDYRAMGELAMRGGKTAIEHLKEGMDTFAADAEPEPEPDGGGSGPSLRSQVRRPEQTQVEGRTLYGVDGSECRIPNGQVEQWVRGQLEGATADQIDALIEANNHDGWIAEIVERLMKRDVPQTAPGWPVSASEPETGDDSGGGASAAHGADIRGNRQAEATALGVTVLGKTYERLGAARTALLKAIATTANPFELAADVSALSQALRADGREPFAVEIEQRFNERIGKRQQSPEPPVEHASEPADSAPPGPDEPDSRQQTPAHNATASAAQVASAGDVPYYLLRDPADYDKRESLAVPDFLDRIAEMTKTAPNMDYAARLRTYTSGALNEIHGLGEEWRAQVDEVRTMLADRIAELKAAQAS